MPRLSPVPAAQRRHTLATPSPTCVTYKLKNFYTLNRLQQIIEPTMPSSAVVDIDLKGLLPKVASGKVRDLFAVDDDTLLFVASDRISAFDVVMDNVS